MKRFSILFCMILFGFAVTVVAQPKPAEKKDETTEAAKPAPAPESFPAKYEGGMYGYNRQDGTLKFDDENERFVFFGKDGKELFGIPYKSLLVIYPQSQSVQSTTGQVVSMIPYAGLLGGFIKEKRRYIVINYDDPDIDAKGMTQFKVADKELLDSVIYSLAEKAKLKPRGDAFYRPSKAKEEEKEKEIN